MTRANLARVGRLMNASLRLGVARPFEMLDCVRDVYVVAVDAGRVERAVEQLARWSDEGPPRLVLLITGLFSDDHHMRGGRPFAEHGLRTQLEQIAPFTALRRCPQLGQRWAGRDEVSGRAGWLRCLFRLRHAVHGLRRAGDDRRC